MRLWNDQHSLRLFRSRVAKEHRPALRSWNIAISIVFDVIGGIPVRKAITLPIPSIAECCGEGKVCVSWTGERSPSLAGFLFFIQHYLAHAYASYPPFLS